MPGQPIRDRFIGKTVIVTGAASGIGKAAAERFSAEGANVVLADWEEQTLTTVAAAFPADRTLAQKTDVTDYAQVEALVDAAVARFGSLDVLVNNAGVGTGGSIIDADFATWDKVMAVNVTGVFYCCRAAMRSLIASKGSIVNTASVSGLGGDWFMSIYNASKGAVVNFTRALALDHGRDGVRVNSVCPTVTVTGMTTHMLGNDALMAKVNERIPLGRPGLAEELAAAIAFLASEDASFITGVNLPVDGGINASNGQPHMFGGV